MLTQFLNRFGYDANITNIYDDMLSGVANKLNLRIIPPDMEVNDIIRTRKNLMCSFVENYQTVFSLPVPIGSRYGPPKYDGYVKGCFIVRGLKYAFVSIDQTLPSYPIVSIVDDVVTCTYNVYEDFRIRHIRMCTDSKKVFSLIIEGTNMTMSECFAHVERVCGVADEVVRTRFKSTCASMAGNDSLILCICDKIADTPIPCAGESDIMKSFTDYTVIIDILAIMTVRLVKAGISRKSDDIDDETFKRVECAGMVFEPLLHRMINSEKMALKKRLLNVESVIVSKFIDGKIHTRSNVLKIGVVQELESLTVIDSLSHIRRVKAYLSEDRAPVRVREYNSRHRGYLCMYETSDSKSAGLNKYLACTAILSRRESFEIKHINKDGNGIPVFHNSKFIGFTTRSKDIINEIHCMKHKNIECYISAYIRDNIMCVLSDEGRIVRPLVYNGIIMMVDIGEYQYLKTHEITELAPMGLSASLISFSHMTPGPRNNYQASMNKQALSHDPRKMWSTSHEEKYLCNKQFPLVATEFMIQYLRQFLDFRHTNVVVAIMADGFNNEDAIILNKASVQRGMFSNIKIINERIFKHDITSKSRRENVEVESSGGYTKQFVRLDFSTAQAYDIYDAVENKYIQSNTNLVSMFDEKGTVRKGIVVEPGSVLQTIYDRSKLNTRCDEKNVCMHGGLVRNTYISDSITDGRSHYVEVQIEKLRLAEVGDKLATDISQKGVVGELREDWEMPYMEDGTIPDVIFNPHGFPSRMTVGTLFSAAICRYLCETSEVSDVIKPHLFPNGSFNATPYRNIDDVIEYLRNNYIEKVPLIGCEERVTIGVLPYICLKQQIDEKAAARRTGSTVSLTGQPIGGRKRGGGSALGEMEVNALMAYGASGILYERLAKQTDLVETLICPQCRMINQIGDICPKCKCQTTRTKIRKPFISFVNILTSLGISTII